MANLLKDKIYFVAGIGTDIGKSFLVENLCKILPNILAIKPIASGFSDDDLNSDSARILRALSLENSPKNINAITPWRFEEPISPHFAARNVQKEIEFQQVVNFCKNHILAATNEDKFLFIEAAGGVMTPINEQKTFLDLAAELQIPVILVTANYLGSISHTLSACKALESKNIIIEKLIINDGLPQESKSLPSIIDTIKNFTSVESILLSELLINLKENDKYH